MSICYLQHEAIGGPGIIASWASSKGIGIDTIRLYEEDFLPDMSDFDWLIIGSGSMSVHDEGKYPYLVNEKEFIRQAISAGKAVLGLCLGAQLVAAVLGAKVYRGPHPEIGWYPLRLTEEARKGLFNGLPEEPISFHWHSDTFDLPEGAVCLVSSNAYANQAFLYNSHVLGLQFHWEVDENWVLEMLRHCGENPATGQYVQEILQIKGNNQSFESTRDYFFSLMDRFYVASHAVHRPI